MIAFLGVHLKRHQEAIVRLRGSPPPPLGENSQGRLEGSAPISTFFSHAMTFFLSPLAVTAAQEAAREETEPVFRRVP